MTEEKIIEMAIEGHASARNAIRWALAQERKACLKFCDEVAEYFPSSGFVGSFIGSKIKARGKNDL